MVFNIRILFSNDDCEEDLTILQTIFSILVSVLFLTFFVWLVVFIMFPYLSITLLHYVLVGIVTMWPKRLDLFYLVSSYIKCTYKASWTCSITWSLYCRLMNGAMGKRSVLIRAPPAGWFADPDRVADPGSFGAPGLRIRTGLAKPGLFF